MNNMPAVCAETKKDRGAFTCGLKGNTSNCCSFSEGEVVECTNKGRDDCDTGGDMEDGMNTIIKLGAINTEEQYPYMYGDCCDPQSGVSQSPCRPPWRLIVTRMRRRVLPHRRLPASKRPRRARLCWCRQRHLGRRRRPRFRRSPPQT